MLDEHYFLIEPTNLSAFCLKNYEEIKHLPNCNNIVRKLSDTRYKRDNSKNIDSFQVVKIMLERKETGHLIRPLMFDNELMASQFYDKVEEFKTLEYLVNYVKYQTWQKKDKAKDYKVYFDFETITDKTHKPYLVRYETEDDERMEFIGDNCALDMLNNLPNKKSIMLIAHNANYDCRFLLKHLSQERPLVKGSRILTCQAVFYRNSIQGMPGDITQKIDITIKDSVKMINMPLRAFGKSFSLEVEKEIMPYAIYSRENIEQRYIQIKDALRHVKDEDIERFNNNIDKWECRDETGERFDILKYSSRYCEMDCRVLRKGYEKIREWMLEYTNLDIANYITIQSLCSDYKLKEGCFDGVAMFSGVIQSYSSRCIIGGRCMTNSNKNVSCKTEISRF